MSAFYVFLVIALESLIEIESSNLPNKRCDECKGELYRVVAKFKTFIDKYGWQISNKDKNELYHFRSQIIHLGKLLEGSHPTASVFIGTQEDLVREHKRASEQRKVRTLESLVEVCFAAFLYSNFNSETPPNNKSES